MALQARGEERDGDEVRYGLDLSGSTSRAGGELETVSYMDVLRRRARKRGEKGKVQQQQQQQQQQGFWMYMVWCLLLF